MGQLRRVVVTGLGMVSPIACGVEATWRRLLASESGVARVENFDVSDLPCKVAAQVPRGGAPDAFNPDDWMEPKEQRHVDDFIIYGMSAATQAMHDAKWEPKTYDEEIETGVLFGSGIGGLGGIYDASVTLHERGPRRISPFFIPGRLINLLSGQVSIAHNLKGPNHAVVTACSTGAHAIGDAGRLIALGDANVMIAGGAESAVNRLALAGFSACRALSTGFNDRPKQASRPYDRDRDGFVMGEGAGCVVLEELEHAKARGAHIYVELVGYGLSGDAYHITAPAPDGDGAFRAMSAALKRAEISPSEMRSNCGRSSACSAIRPQRRRCPRPSPRLAIFWARRVRWSRSSASSPSATRSRRRRSILTTPPWRPRSILRPTYRESGRFRRRCPTPSASAAQTLRSSSVR
jgi:3-oxoacyl-[acyl-carrier-protein] synthase II